MLQHYTLLLASSLAFGPLAAQTTDLVFFSDDGLKFTLLVDGDQKNAKPASRVVASGIRNEQPMLIINFEDPGVAPIKKAGYFPLGMEYTMMITTNKKGEKVIRATGQAALGNSGALVIDEKPRPTEFRDDNPAVLENPSGTTGSTVIVTEQTIQPLDGEHVHMNVDMNGVGVNMNVNVTGTTSATSTTTTTTTTTTYVVDESPNTTATRPPAPEPEPEPEVYYMPGYTGRIGCPWPMSPSEFADAKTSIGSKSFEDTKMSMAKQVVSDRCVTVDQVKGVMQLFSFEESKLDFAKFAYDHTYDLSNYYKLNDAFTFESSVDDLSTFLRDR
ncbi:MAG: DUF4476 domain-containing protein [Flavobacteriales bacterium]|nr:DUF4476 domain-containing protein [Flavobacteriales bacterium]